MNVIRNVFHRNSRKDDIHFTEVTILSPGAFSDKRNDWTDLQYQKNISEAPSGFKRVFNECRVSPMKDTVDRQPVYTKEDLKRIADMFLVSYTHCTNEDELTIHQEKMTKRNVKRGRKLFKQIHKLIS